MGYVACFSFPGSLLKNVKLRFHPVFQENKYKIQQTIKMKPEPAGEMWRSDMRLSGDQPAV